MAFHIFPYVLTCPKTLSRLPAFYDAWNGAFNRFRSGKANENDSKSLFVNKIEEVRGMNSERFARSPFWRVGAERTELPDRMTGNGLDRRGHTACYWGHVQEWRKAVADLDSFFDVLEFEGEPVTTAAAFFEDDAIVDADIWERTAAAVQELPGDWDIFYFGGEHCVHGRPRPAEYSPSLFKVNNVNRTHGYMVKLQSLPKIVLWFEENWDWGHNFRDPKTGQSEAEVDYALGHLTETGFLNGYALRRWACGQNAGFSWTQGANEGFRRWELQ